MNINYFRWLRTSLFSIIFSSFFRVRSRICLLGFMRVSVRSCVGRRGYCKKMALLCRAIVNHSLSWQACCFLQCISRLTHLRSDLDSGRVSYGWDILLFFHISVPGSDSSLRRYRPLPVSVAAFTHYAIDGFQTSFWLRTLQPGRRITTCGAGQQGSQKIFVSGGHGVQLHCRGICMVHRQTWKA